MTTCWTSLPARVGLALALVAVAASAQAAVRGKQHEEYAHNLWDYLQKADYTHWRAAPAGLELPEGPAGDSVSKTYLNRVAASARSADLPFRSMLVTNHYAGGKLVAVTVRFRVSEGYSPKTHDWYWAHFTPSGWLAKSSVDKNSFDRPGFVSFIDDGRLWVFREICPELAEYGANKELAKHVTQPGGGPGGLTIKGPDSETIAEYTTAREGFVTRLDDGRLWIFRAGSPELEAFEKSGELAKHVILPGAGPDGLTLKSPDRETIDAYLAARPGFVTFGEDGRVWVFRRSCPELAAFRKTGELAKHVIRPGAGPDGVTLKAPDAETLDSYLTQRPGFATFVEDGRLWIFREDSQELAQYQKDGELAKHVTLPGAGPDGVTVKGPDSETILSYLTACEGFETFVEDDRLWVFRVGSEELDEYKQNGELAKHVTRIGEGPQGMTIKAPDGDTIDAYLQAAGISGSGE